MNKDIPDIQVNQVIQILAELNVNARIDKLSKSINAPLCFGETDKNVIILTSPAAIRQYDSYHPERIEFLVLKKQKNSVLSFYVVVNNREIDLEKAIRFWWLNETTFTPEEMSCCVCLSRSTKRKYTTCCHCRSLLCLSCENKLTNNDSMQCPICRQWKLYGDDFGRPFIENSLDDFDDFGSKSNKSNKSINTLYNIIDHLDGCTRIILRVDKVFKFDEMLSITKLTNTDRYADGSRRLKDIKKALNKKCAKYILYTQDITIWLFRNTFKILDKPMQEVSVFRLCIENQKITDLYQYSRDAWVNVINYDDEVPLEMVKIEYIKPHKFVLPEYVMQAFNDIVNLNTYEKTISIVDSEKNGMNFDMDSSGNIVTMHEDMLAACTCALIQTSKAKLYIICRSHTTCEAFELDVINRKSNRLSPKQVKKLMKQDLDGLNCV